MAMWKRKAEKRRTATEKGEVAKAAAVKRPAKRKTAAMTAPGFDGGSDARQPFLDFLALYRSWTTGLNWLSRSSSSNSLAISLRRRLRL
jgi:hypothetical protein